MSEDTLIEERRKKVADVRAAGVDPYPHIFRPTDFAKDIAQITLEPEQELEKKVVVAGRVMLLRKMGKASFFHIQDSSGQVQIFITKDNVGEETYATFKKVDIGDFVGVEGKIFATKTGETSVKAEKFTLLTKSLRPLPDKHHGLQEKELRYRKRHLDLITSPEVREVFKKRSAIIRSIREFMHEKGYMEVETPLLQTQYGGANAKPFVTHIHAWDMPMYLSISPELYLKRLIVGGFDKVYTICKNFRNEGVDHSHNPEFTMLEAYAAYQDYTDMMALIEECFEFVAQQVLGTTKITRTIEKDGKQEDVLIDVKAPWPKMTMLEAIEKELNVSVKDMSVEELNEILRKHQIEPEGDATWGYRVLQIFDELVEHTIIQPTHVIDRPRESTPLCKEVRYADKRLVEQNEPVGVGMELANMYSELNDPDLQRSLLENQAAQLRGGDDEAHPMDEDFVQCIETGMPPTGGIGWGIDRMILLLLNQESIRDILLFPTMKPKEEQSASEEHKQQQETPAAKSPNAANTKTTSTKQVNQMRNK